MNSRALGLVLAAGAALRFATLDVQSLWYDEAVTARLLRMDLGAMLRAIPGSESTPPLYYVLAWLWTQLLGTGEAGMRSLSALLGTATIGVVWALGRRLGGDRAALAAAALAAFSPLLQWFSQEARAYALLALLAALAALLWLRALEQPRARRPRSPGAPSPRSRWRRTTTRSFSSPPRGCGSSCVHRAGVPASRRSASRSRRAPPSRRWRSPSAPTTGRRSSPPAAARRVGAGAQAVSRRLRRAGRDGCSPCSWRSSGSSRCGARARCPAGVASRFDGPAGDDGGGAGSARPPPTARVAALGLALSPRPCEDHLITRNVLGALPLGAALPGAGLAAAGVAPRSRRPPPPACPAVAIAARRRRPPPAARGLARRRGALGAAPRQRAVLVSPAAGAAVLAYYLPASAPVTSPPASAGELDFVASWAPHDPGARPTAPAIAAATAAAGGPPVAAVRRATFSILRCGAARRASRALLADAIAAGLRSDAALLALPAVKLTPSSRSR